MLDIISDTWSRYRTKTPVLIQFLDLFIIFAGFMAVGVFMYGLFASNNPYNAFISAVFATAGPLFFTVNLRMQLMDPKAFFYRSPEHAFLSYVACNGLLFFILSSFLG